MVGRWLKVWLSWRLLLLLFGFVLILAVLLLRSSEELPLLEVCSFPEPVMLPLEEEVVNTDTPPPSKITRMNPLIPLLPLPFAGEDNGEDTVADIVEDTAEDTDEDEPEPNVVRRRRR